MKLRKAGKELTDKGEVFRTELALNGKFGNRLTAR
jgi:hypothetical protein